MTLIALKCPNCKGTVQMEDDMVKGFCVHCGVKIIREQNVKGKVSVDRTGDIINHLRLAEEKLTAKNWAAAERLVENTLLIDPDCLDARYMTALLHYRDKVAYKGILSEIESKKLNDYGRFSKDDIKRCWGEHEVRIRMEGKARILKYMKIVTSIDNKDPVLMIESGVIFGVNSGKHMITARLAGSIDGRELSREGAFEFIAEGDIDFEIRVGLAYDLKIIWLDPNARPDPVKAMFIGRRTKSQ